MRLGPVSRASGERLDEGARAAKRRPGDAHARDHSRRLEARLLGVRGGDQGRPARVVAARAEAAAGRARARVDRARATSADGEWPRRREELAGVVGQGWACWGLGSSSYGCRPREHGTSVVRTQYQTAERWIGPRTSIARPRSTTSSGVTSRPSARRRARTSRRGPDSISVISCRHRAPEPPAIRRRAREGAARSFRAPRSPTRARPRRCVFSRPGRGAARPRTPSRDPARALPAARLLDEESSVRPDVSRRRRRCGAWRYDAGRIRIDPYERLDSAMRRELHDEAERLAAFHE